MGNQGRIALQYEEQILAAIRAQPGLSFRGLRRVVGGSIPNLRSRLASLMIQDLIFVELRKGVGKKRNRPHRIYPIEALDDVALFQALCSADLRRLLGAMIQRCKLKEGRVERWLLLVDVVNLASRWGWSRTTTRRRLARLVEAELVAVNEGPTMFRGYCPTTNAADLLALWPEPQVPISVVIEPGGITDAWIREKSLED